MYWMLIIPILVVIYLYIQFPHRMVWYEYLIPPVGTFFAILILSTTCDYIVSWDTEYHGGWVTQSVWTEHWTETYIETETDTDSNGKTTTKVVTKTRYHPDEYIITDSNNYNVNIDEGHFEFLAHKFGNRKIDKPWNIGQSSWGDGRLFTTVYPNTKETFTPCFTKHRYTNKVAVSHSVFNFKTVNKKDQDTYHLYQYPSIYNYYSQNSILGWGDPIAEKTLTEANARLGSIKQVRIFILMFPNQPLQAGLLQQQLWKNGNKNEVVVCIGTNGNKVTWVYPFAWDNERLLVDLREDVASNKSVDMINIVNTINKLVETKFSRKHFKDFDYIQVDPPMWAKVICFIITAAINYGIIMWVINNDR